jgi:hypothetical protein
VVGLDSRWSAATISGLTGSGRWDMHMSGPAVLTAATQRLAWVCENSTAGALRRIEEEEGPSGEGPGHSGDTKDADRPKEIIDEDREAHFGSRIAQASGREVPLVHASLADAYSTFELLGVGVVCVRDPERPEAGPPCCARSRNRFAER